MKKPWSFHIIGKYVLLQLPALAMLIVLLMLAKQWIELPPWFMWGLVVLWVAKDMALFPLTWTAYDKDRRTTDNPIIGTHGTAEEQLHPSGYIRIKGELWRAEVVGNAPAIQKGESVRVEGIRGLTLLVKPGDDEANR